MPPTGAGQGGNLVIAWLDAVGLPWRSTRADLATRFGVRHDNPCRWDLVSLDVQPAQVAQSERADDLNEVTEGLASAAGKVVRLGDYDRDT